MVAATGTAASVEAAATAACVGASAAATTVAAAMLGEGRRGCAKQAKRSDKSEKSLEQGGFLHICIPSTERRPTAQAGSLPKHMVPLVGTPFQWESCTVECDFRSEKASLTTFQPQWIQPTRCSNPRTWSGSRRSLERWNKLTSARNEASQVLSATACSQQLSLGRAETEIVAVRISHRKLT
jgi:hypothetical protein